MFEELVCPGCDSTAHDRERSGATDDEVWLRPCPFCDQQKCYICDMGDDVRCASCSGENDD